MGMVINHNLSALNTFNQLNTNNTLMNNSLAKLSSGYKINSAADDAAGLSISEKMRGQIRGLDQANANAQDAISMTQTAEGALDETTSILQRMRELAVQASTDTLTDDDRTAVQDEMDALTSEINRIGNTTEFNTKKLLNGGGVETSLKVNTVKAGSAAGAFEGAAAYTRTAVTAVAANSGAITVDGTNTVTVDAGTDNGAAANAYSIAFDNTGSGSTTADVSGTTITVHLDVADSTVTAANIQSAIQGLTISGLDMSKFTVTTSADIDGTGTITAASTALNTSTAGVTGVTAITAADNADTIPVSQLTSSTAAVAAKWTSGGITALGNNSTGTITFNGVTVTVNTVAAGSEVAAAATDGRTASVSITNGSDADATATAIVNAFKAAQAYGGTELADFTFATDAANDAFTITDKATNGATNNALTLSASGLTIANNNADATDADNTDGVTEVRGVYTMDIEKAFEAAGMSINIGGQTFTTVASGADASKGQINVGTDEHTQALELAKAINSNTTLGARFDATVDDAGKITLTEKATKATGVNTTITNNNYVIGNEATAGVYDFTIDTVVAVGGKYEIDGVKIAVTDDASDARIAQGTAVLYNADKATQAQNLLAAIKANSTLNTKYDTTTTTPPASYASGGTITLKQKTGQESMVATTALKGTNADDAFTATFQIGANTGQTMGLSVSDMRSEALKVSSETASSEVTVQDSDGNNVTASYKATKTVTDGTSETGTEYSLDVSTADKATAAISVIDDATSTVSAARSKLGAVINRLEHTINNLTTSSENMTSAESRIRDVDMASEMATYTNKSVLNQAATAMLAKANQQPQQVLSLLQG